ncbi:MAG: alpha/beta hydrolase [Acetobacteraceae bacterium]
MIVVLAAIAFAALAYASFMLWVYTRQSRRMYRPLREIVAVPAERGFVYEDVGFAAADGTRLHGWYVPCPGARYVLLFLHGSTRNISWCLDTLELFHRMGFSTFLFDYRGYGLSEGRPDEEGTYRDAAAAWDYLVHERAFEAGRIVVMGRSLGGAVASWLAARHPPRALVLESTFLSFPDLAAVLHPRLPARLLARYRYPVKDYIRQVRCPVLLVHSRDDDLIPYQHASMLYGIANEPKRLVDIAGPHYDGYLLSGDRYIDGLARFFGEFL